MARPSPSQIPYVPRSVRPAFPDSLHLLLPDNSRAQMAQQLTVPANVCFRCLPPYGPELNPIEWVWRDLKDARAWLQFANLEAQQAYEASTL